MIIKFINYINTIIPAIPIKCKYEEKKYYLKNNLCFKLVGNIKNAKKILICLHGMGGSKDAPYVNLILNSFIDEFNEKESCVIAPDMPGINDSIHTEYIWGIQNNTHDVYLNDILDFIKLNNKDAKIFIAGFSASCGVLINFLTDNGTIIKNTNKDLISYSFLVSPPGPFIDSLMWVRDNSVFKFYISFCHSAAQFKFLLHKANFKKLF
jgi:predicted alpha/beta-fold hydrolase